MDGGIVGVESEYVVGLGGGAFLFGVRKGVGSGWISSFFFGRVYLVLVYYVNIFIVCGE